CTSFLLSLWNDRRLENRHRWTIGDPHLAVKESKPPTASDRTRYPSPLPGAYRVNPLVRAGKTLETRRSSCFGGARPPVQLERALPRRRGRDGAAGGGRSGGGCGADAVETRAADPFQDESVLLALPRPAPAEAAAVEVPVLAGDADLLEGLA